MWTTILRQPVNVLTAGTIVGKHYGRQNPRRRIYHNENSLGLFTCYLPPLPFSRTFSQKSATASSTATSSKFPQAKHDPDQWRSQLLYVDSKLCILNKKPGIAVHTGTNQERNNLSTLMRSLEQYLHQHDDPHRNSDDEPALQSISSSRSSPSTALRLVHRLDKETSGCLMLARTRQAAQLLGELLRREGGQDSDELLDESNEDTKAKTKRKQSKQTIVHSIQNHMHQIQPQPQDLSSTIPSYSTQVWSTPFVTPAVDSGVQKRYLAIVHGIPERKDGAITSIISADGKQAVSSYRTLASVSFVAATTVGGAVNSGGNTSKTSSTPVAFSLLQLMPHTGRKRQLRLHCFHDLQCPIVGEKLSHVVGDFDSNSTNTSGKSPSIMWTRAHSLRQERMQHVENQLWKFVNDQERDSSVFQSPFIPSPPSSANPSRAPSNSASSLPLLLHAHELFVLHPKVNEGRLIHATAPLPRNFYRAVRALFGENVIPATADDSA